MLGQTVDDFFGKIHVHHKDLYGVGDNTEAYEIFLQNNSWTHFEIQYITFFVYDNICSSVFVQPRVIFILIHYMRSSYFFGKIIGK